MKEYPCDFYLVAGHCVGRVSLTMYLAALGLCPTTGIFWKDKPGRREQSLREMARFRQEDAPYVGLTVDCLLTDPPDEKLLSWKVPVIWLVRDPVLLITSFLNLYNRESLIEAYFKGIPHPMVFDPARGCHNILNHPADLLYYHSLLRTVQSPSSLRVVDTSETGPDQIVSTLTRITAGFGVPDIAARQEELSLAHGSLRQTLRVALPGLPLTRPGGGPPLEVCFYPASTTVRMAYFLGKNPTILDTIEAGEESFKIIVWDVEDEAEAAAVALTPENREVMTKYLDEALVLSGFVEGLCREKEFTPAQVAETIRSDGPCRRRFRELWETEWSLVEHYAPGLTQTWEMARSVFS